MQRGGLAAAELGASAQQAVQLPVFNASMFEGTSKYPLFEGAYGEAAVNNLTGARRTTPHRTGHAPIHGGSASASGGTTGCAVL